MKFKKLLICLSTPIMASISLIPLVSCGEPEIRPSDDTEDVNVLNRYEISKIYKNKDFTVKLTNPKPNYTKFSKTQTQVTIGNNVVTPVWSADCKSFKVNGGDVTSDEIHISLVAEATLNTIGYDWEKSYWTNICTFHPGEKIRAATSESVLNDFSVWALYGDGTGVESEEDWRLLTVGTDDPEHQVQVWKNDLVTQEYTDITASFKTNGYTFEDDDVGTSTAGKRRPGVHHFQLKYVYTDPTTGTTYWKQDQVSCLCAYAINEDEVTATPEASTIEPEASTSITTTVKEGAYNDCYFLLAPDSELGEDDIILDAKTGEVKATTKTGVATIRVYWLDNPKFYKTVTITVAKPS